MVSTRSHSVLSADGAHADTAATAGEVSSAAPTPRRSGRLSRGAATPTAAAAAAKAPPASARAARSRRPLKAIAEEQAADEQQAAAAQQQQQEQEQKQEGAGEHAAAPRARRRSGTAAAAAATAPAQQQEEADDAAAEEAHAAAGEGGSDVAAAAGQAEPLKANAAVVDLLAQQMFEALDGAFGAGAGGSSSSSESESEPEPAAQAAAGQQQHQEQQAAVDAGQGSSDEGSDSEGEGQGHHVPAHLRWRPELTLPGMGPPQQRQRGGSTQAAPAAAAAAAPSVHVVRRGGKDSLHVPPPDERARARAARKTAPDTAGKGWFDLPATKITDEVKSDLRMLRLRWVCGGAAGPLFAQLPQRLAALHPSRRGALDATAHFNTQLLLSCHSASLPFLLPVPQGCAGPQGALQEAGRHQIPKVLPDGDRGGGRRRLLLG